MQYAPHGVELQWRARERVAGDGAATALLLEKVHGFILSESTQEVSFQVPRPAFAQQQRCIMSRVDTRYVLENLREAGIPLAVLTGSHDAVTPVKVAEEMSSIAGSLCPNPHMWF